MSRARKSTLKTSPTSVVVHFVRVKISRIIWKLRNRARLKKINNFEEFTEPCTTQKIYKQEPNECCSRFCTCENFTNLVKITQPCTTQEYTVRYAACAVITTNDTFVFVYCCSISDVSTLAFTKTRKQAGRIVQSFEVSPSTTTTTTTTKQLEHGNWNRSCLFLQLSLRLRL